MDFDNYSVLNNFSAMSWRDRSHRRLREKHHHAAEGHHPLPNHSERIRLSLQCNVQMATFEFWDITWDLIWCLRSNITFHSSSCTLLLGTVLVALMTTIQKVEKLPFKLIVSLVQMSVVAFLSLIFLLFNSSLTHSWLWCLFCFLSSSSFDFWTSSASGSGVFTIPCLMWII